MKIILKKNDLKKLVKNNKNLGFVPTMGGLHKGHEQLIKKSLSLCEKTIVSIFVNKYQFNNKKDLLKYPRMIKKDILYLKKLRVNYLYLPTNNQIYPKGPKKKIKIHSFEKVLCGKFRPGHFKAVVDVIDRFIKIINPRKLFLGEKDMQQLKIVEYFINQKYKKIKLIACKTIREENGVPYSSRNFSLSKNQLKIASSVYKLILKCKKKLLSKKISLAFVKKQIKKIGVSRIEYIDIFDINKIIKPYIKKNKHKIFISYYLNKTRLIDNI